MMYVVNMNVELLEEWGVVVIMLWVVFFLILVFIVLRGLVLYFEEKKVEERRQWINKTILLLTKDLFDFVVKSLDIQVVEEDREELVEYFARYPHLLTCLSVAGAEIRRQFPGDGTVLVLEMNRDPEIEEYTFPVLVFRLEKYGEDFVEKLEKIDRSYLRLIGDEGWFLVTTDFKYSKNVNEIEELRSSM